MTKAQITKQVLKLGPWGIWLERPFRAFLLSIWKEGNSRKYMRRAGMNAEVPAFLFENSRWYWSDKCMAAFESGLKKEMERGKDIFYVSKQCRKFYNRSKKTIQALRHSKQSPQKKLTVVYEIFKLNSAFVWLAHGLEIIYTKKLESEVSKYFSGNTQKIIGDLSFPKKKNAYALMEDALRRGTSLKAVARKYGFLKVRDGFSDPFTEQELRELQKKLRRTKPAAHATMQTPASLQPLIKEAQELVFYRTYRTDVLYELLFLSRPILEEAAHNYGMHFAELADYSIEDLVKGKPKKYSPNPSMVAYREHYALFEGDILPKQTITSTQLKGTIAFPGVARGKAKIVRTVQDLAKVTNKDVLVTQMTVPAFIMAMKKAVAFVTDEGGMTCHAAIVAREMQKPCITGTKYATQILNDGDMVEVDAIKGTVKKIR